MKSGTFGRLILCASFLYSFCSYGDVFKARVDSTDITVTKRKEATSETDPNAQQFVDFINGVGDFAEERSFDKQCKNNPERFPSDDGAGAAIDWEMPGCAVFIPEDAKLGDSCSIYVAKKRPGKGVSVADNNPDEHDTVVAKEKKRVDKNERRLFHYSSDMHTERQLVIIALEDAYLKKSSGTQLSIVEEAESKIDASLGLLRDSAIIPLQNDAIAPLINDEIRASLSGQLYVYTDSNPCLDDNATNNNFSCVKYYNKLANLFPRIHFHVYFVAAKMRMSAKGMKQLMGDEVVRQKTLLLVKDLIDLHIDKIKTCPTVLIQEVPDGAWSSINGLYQEEGKWNHTSNNKDLIFGIINAFNAYLTDQKGTNIKAVNTAFIANIPPTPSNVFYHVM